MRTTSWREWIYYHSPPPLQAAFFNWHAWTVERHRYGAAFRDTLRWLQSRERATTDEIRTYQDVQVRRIVRWASERSPYYRRLFQQHGLDPQSIGGVADLGRIPLTTKDQVRAHWPEFLTSAPESTWLPGATSGTTGTPLQLWYDQGTCVLNNAVDRRNKVWAGAKPDDWFGMLLGRMVVNPGRARPPFWQVNHIQRQVWFSSFHLHPQHLRAMVDEVQRRRLRFLEGYPSTLHVLARYVLDMGTTLPMIAVISSSETLHDLQRADIEAAFDCSLFDFYASAERVLFAAECEAHDGKHLIEEYGYVEVVDDVGRPLPSGSQGYLVGTTLHNTAMPLLRYRMGDVTSLSEEPCPCGRAGRRMASITTKSEDLITTLEGRVVSPSTLTHPFKVVRGVEKSQIVQERPDLLTIRIVATDAFTKDEESRLVAHLQDRVGAAMQIVLRRESDIPREASGKFRWVVSHVAVPPFVGTSGGDV